MFFQRQSQHDERRRRVLNEEVRGTAAETTRPSPRSSGKGGNYGERSFISGRSRIVDLVPLGYGAMAALLFVGVALIAGFEALYFYMPELARQTTDGRVAAFDLDGEGSLGAWFSSFQLLLASALSWIIFSVRRHKPDDYHGRYRIWIAAALVWFLMSVDEAASLHEGFKEMMSLAAGTRIAGDGSLWWVMAYLLVLGYVGLRLVLEMRRVRAANAVLWLAGGCYAMAVAVQLEWLMPQTGARGVMLEEGLEMAGNLWLLLSLTLYARHVILESQGLQSARPKKVKAKADSPQPAKRSKRRSTDVEADAPQPASSKAASVGTTTRVRHRAHTAGPDDESGDDRQGQRKLSKAERKALRKQKRHEQNMGLR